MRLLSLITVLLVAGCDSTGLSDAERAAFERDIDAARAAATAAIGLARADDLGACRTAVLTTDACGYGTTFAPYSATDGDVAEIERLAARHDSLSRAYDVALGNEQACLARSEPVLVLEDGRCLFESRVVYD